MARPRTRRAVAEDKERAKEKAISETSEQIRAPARAVVANPAPAEEQQQQQQSSRAPEHVPQSAAKDSEKTETEPPALESGAKGSEKVSTGKRRRRSERSPEPDYEREEKRQRRQESRIREILRPGVPAPVSTRAFLFPDRYSGPERGDNKDGHYEYVLGDNLTSRYKVLSKMGEGTFGRVLECWDRKNKSYVAIKIVRNIQKYRDAAMLELEVLNTLTVNDRDGRFHCVRLREWFDYRKHVCMVFEKLGLSLYDFLRKNNYRPFSIDFVRVFGRQLLQSVAYLHDLNLIHTDLKPENILLESLEYDRYYAGSAKQKVVIRIPRSTAIKLIDFGSATFDDQHHSSIVSTRHYRAPEVILGLGWSFPVDMWSIGCILVELATGSALFQTHDNLEHLAMMQQVLGPIPDSVAAFASQKPAGKYFNRRNRLVWPQHAKNNKSVSAVNKLSSLRKLLAEQGDKSVLSWLDNLVDLLKQMMRYEPSARIKAKEALQHPFFRMSNSELDTGIGLNELSKSRAASEIIVLED